MRAVQMFGWQTPPELRDVPEPEPGPPFRFGVVPFETPVVFSNWGTRAGLAEVVGLAQAGAIHIETERVTLEEVPAAYDRLGAGQVRGRVVAVP